jgi:hypothetical protein
MESDQTLAHEFNQLVQTHGLTSVLEAVNDLILVRINAIEALQEPFDRQQISALRNVAQALTELSQLSLIDMDVEIALEQLVHASSTLETSDDQLSSGMA